MHTMTKEFKEAFGSVFHARPMTDFEQVIERAVDAAAKAMDASAQLEAARREMRDLLQRAGDATHRNQQEKAILIAVWRETLVQLDKACDALNGASNSKVENRG